MHEEQEHAMMKPIALYTNLEKLVKREEAERGEGRGERFSLVWNVPGPYSVGKMSGQEPAEGDAQFCLHILSSVTSVGDLTFSHPLLLLPDPLSLVFHITKLSPFSAVLRSSWASEAFKKIPEHNFCC